MRPKYLSRIVFWSLLMQLVMFFSSSPNAIAGAQLSSSHGFLQGQYVEVGIRPNGAFGSSGSPSPIPAGFHATNAPCLGFRVDRAKDGWGVGTDDGDFFCPGTPYEEWMMNIGGNVASNSNAGTSIAGALSSPTTSGTTHSITWNSTSNYQGVTVQIISSIDETGQSLNTDVTLTNSTASAINNIYFGRGVDPDNATNSDTYNSTNTITGQGSSSFVKAVFSNGSLIGLRSTDSRARVARNASSFATGQDPKAVWDAGEALTASGAILGNLSSTAADAGMYLALKIPTLNANSSTSFRISYVLTLTESQIPSVNTSATTNLATNLKSTTSTLNGAVNANGVSTNTYFEYSTNSNFADSVTVSSQVLSTNVESNISSNISGLTPSTIYYFRVRATNTSGVTVGSIFSFKTFPTIIIQPKNETTTAGLVDTFTVSTTQLLSGQSKAVKWQVSTDTLTSSTWSDVLTGTGYNSETVTTVSTTVAMNKYRYRAIITFTDTSTTYVETSTTSILTVNPQISFTSSTSTITKKYGESFISRIVTFSGGTDTKTLTVSSTSIASGKITFNLSNYTFGIDTATSVGNYFDTITVTDALGSYSQYVQQITVNQADSITIQTDTLTAVTYNPNGQVIVPTNVVTGLVAGDQVSSLNYSYTGGAGNSYNSSTPPTNVGTYSIISSNLILANSISLNNYAGVMYKPGSVSILKANQSNLSISSTFSAFIGAPTFLPLNTYGGSDTGTITYAIASGGTATGCAISSSTLSANSAGTCKVVATKAATNNYLIAYSDTATITFSLFVSNQPIQTQSVPVQIPISGKNNLDLTQINTIPAVTGVFLVGSTYEINGTGFTGASRVIIGGTEASISSVTDTKIVIASAGLMPGPLFVECSDGRIGPSPFYFFTP